MALTAQELAQVNSISQTTTNIETLVQTLVSIFNAGGVANPDLATLKAELQTYADSKVAGQMTGNAATATMASDVDLGGGLTAKGQGMFGYAVLTNLDANLLTTPGRYFYYNSSIAEAEARNLPPLAGHAYLTVEKVSQYIIQKTDNIFGDYCLQRRLGGGSWSKWSLIRLFSYGNFTVFISKDGSDANSGLSLEHPVSSVNAALSTALRIKTFGSITFSFGPGDWGDIYIRENNLQCRTVYINSINNNDNAKFNTINFNGSMNCILKDIEFMALNARNYAIVTLDGNIKFGKISINNSYVTNTKSCNLIVKNNDDSTQIFYCIGGSLFITDLGTSTFTFEDNLHQNIFIHASYGTRMTIGSDNASAFNYSGTFTGKKYNIFEYAVNDQYASKPDTFPGNVGGTGNYQIGTAYTGLFPVTDAVHSLGSQNSRWNQLFAATGTINTSDEREKLSVSDIPDSVLDAWANVRLRQYQMKDSVDKKGVAKARIHTGVIAQPVAEQLKAKGIDPTRYGFFCYDSWETKDWDETVEVSPEEWDNVEVGKDPNTGEPIYEYKKVKDAVTEVVHHHEDGGDRYGIRYEELLVIEAAYQRRLNARLEARIAALEAKLNK